jgi:hypothetical protein
MKTATKNTLLAGSCLLLMLSYQNCGKSFEAASGSGEMASSAAESTPDDNAGNTTTPTTPSDPATPPPPPPKDTASPPTPADPSDAGRRILKVCASGCPYTLPSQANAAAMDTDIIEVQAGTYNDCFGISKNGLKFRGVGGRAHMTTKMCLSKGLIVVMGNDTVIENFEFSQMAVGDHNGAGIRHQGLGLIVRNSYFHDGEDGILSGTSVAGAGGDKDLVLVENSKFEHLGGGTGQAHAVYFGAHKQVTIRNSLFLASRDQGHEFKSRALTSNIDCSMMASLDGVDSYSLNFPDAGQVIVTNSVVEQGANSANSGIVDYGSEMVHTAPVNTMSFNKVTVLNDASGGSFFNVRHSTQFTITDSVTAGPGTQYSIQQAVEQGSQHFASRNAAGFSAYPSLPKPAACSGGIGLLN